MVDGRGTGSSIDSVITLDSDYNPSGGNTSRNWANSAGSLMSRYFYVQNWRADVVGIVDNYNGKLIEAVRYSAYGTPTYFSYGYGNADYNNDSVVGDVADLFGYINDWLARCATTPPVSPCIGNADIDASGTVDVADLFGFINTWLAHSVPVTGVRGQLSGAIVNNRKGYAGYECDTGYYTYDDDNYTPIYSGNGCSMYHVRNRTYFPVLGRFGRRDPIGYVGGMNLYSYVREMPLRFVDPLGLRATRDENKEGVDLFGIGVIVGIGGTVEIKYEATTSPCCTVDGYASTQTKFCLSYEAWVGLGIGGLVRVPVIGGLNLTYKAMGISTEDKICIESDCGGQALCELSIPVNLCLDINNSFTTETFGFGGSISAGAKACVQGLISYNRCTGKSDGRVDLVWSAWVKGSLKYRNGFGMYIEIARFFDEKNGSRQIE